ncbi:MAG: hypothetical protein PHI99_01845 [Syntrophales bacterium]|nr:hypothetical protein [Syntrophales bacterium]
MIERIHAESHRCLEKINDVTHRNLQGANRVMRIILLFESIMGAVSPLLLRG